MSSVIEEAIETVTEQLAQQYEACIRLTEQGSEILREMDPDTPAIAERQKKIVEMQGRVNALRGFDSVEMGC